MIEAKSQSALVLQASGFSWGQAVWGEPILTAADATQRKLTELIPVAAHVGWGEFSVNHVPHQWRAAGGSGGETRLQTPERSRIFPPREISGIDPALPAVPHCLRQPNRNQR